MSRPHVLRIPRSDEDEGSFVLVHVQSSHFKKSRPLDVKIIATEGTAPYVITLKHSNIQALKSQGSPCTNDEWEQILESLLLGQDLIPDIHLTAAVRSGLEITVRKKIQRITQRLGVINLEEDEGEAIELFDWCGLAIESTNNARAELASAKAKAQEFEQAVSELSKQLDELVQAKAEHEAALLEKFRLLLNEKKAKIRDQHELITSRCLGVQTPGETNRPDREGDQGKIEEDEDRNATLLAKAARQPVAQPKSKRKAPAAEPSSDSDDGLDVMDVDRPKQSEHDYGLHGNSSGKEKQTSDEDDRATASEPEDIGTSSDERAKSISPVATTAASATAAASAPTPVITRQESNGKSIATRARKIPPKASAAYKDDDGSETETDDEL